MTAYRGREATYSEAPSVFPVCRISGCLQPPAFPEPEEPGDLDLCRDHLEATQHARDTANATVCYEQPNGRLVVRRR